MKIYLDGEEQVVADDVTVGDDLSVTDDASVGGDLAITGDITTVGTITATGTIDVNSNTEIASNGIIKWGPSGLNGELTWDTNVARLGGRTGMATHITANNLATVIIDTDGNINYHGTSGAVFGIKYITELTTVAVGTGATPVVLTTGDLAPANSLILGAVARIIDAPGGGATTLDIGVTGSGNLDTLVDGMSTALNTTANTPSDGDGTQLPLLNGAATTLTLTTDGDVTGDDMIVRIGVFYFDFTAFTA
jgi:hypothetical protein